MQFLNLKDVWQNVQMENNVLGEKDGSCFCGTHIKDTPHGVMIVKSLLNR